MQRLRKLWESSVSELQGQRLEIRGRGSRVSALCGVSLSVSDILLHCLRVRHESPTLSRAVENIIGGALRLGRCVNQKFAIVAKPFLEPSRNVRGLICNDRV